MDKKNAIGMCSTHNEGKSVVAERFIRNLNNKIYKCMTSISKNMNIVTLDDIIKTYNSIYHSTIKMKPVNVKLNTYISKEINNKDPKFKVSNIVRIPIYENIFAEGFVPNWSEEGFVIKKIKNTVLWTYVMSDLKGEEIVRTTYVKELQRNCKKQVKKSLEFKK